MYIPTRRLAAIGLFLPLSLIACFLMVGIVFGTGVHEDIGSPLAAVGCALCLAVGGGLWARALTPAALRARRIIMAGALCYLVITLAAGQGLGTLEREFVENGGTTLPLHVLYTLLFVPTSFVTSGLLSLAMTIAAGRSIRIAFLPALASAMTYLAMNVLQDLLGRRVGGPNASETATMITVTFVCITGSAIVFTILLGRLLYRELPVPASSPDVVLAEGMSVSAQQGVQS